MKHIFSQLQNMSKKTAFWLKTSYLFIFFISLYGLYSISHISSVYNIFKSFGGLVLDPITTTCILGLIYLGMFILGYFLLFSNSGKEISNKKYFTYSLVLVLILAAIILTLAGNNSTIDYRNDNDENLEIWINSLFSFNYPYVEITQLQNHLSPLPFLPILAIPFHLLGNVAYLNIINIIILILILKNLSKNRNQFNFGLISLLLSVPLNILLITQSDHITIAILTALGVYLLYKERLTLGSIIFGLLIASKGSVWLIIPTTLYYISHVKKEFLKKSVIIYVLIPLIFIIPFALWKPNIFFFISPLGTENSLLNYFPYSGILITLSIILISLLSYKITRNLFAAFFVTYLGFSIFLFSRSMLLLIIATIMLGIHQEKSRTA